jgi:hypothetical protein
VPLTNNVHAGNPTNRQSLCQEFLETLFGQTVLFRVQAVNDSSQYLNIMRQTKGDIEYNILNDHHYIMRLLHEPRLRGLVS